MGVFVKPEPIDREIILDPSKVIISKTDPKGVIEYANEYFMEICGYMEYELMGRAHNVIRHPDMPKVIFKFMWDRLHRGENFFAIVKNLTKDGRFYWVVTTFETKYNEDGSVRAHYARRKAVPKKARVVVEKLYKIIRSIELRDNEKAAEIAAANYFYGFIEDSGKTYDQFMLDILETDQETFNKYFYDENLNLNASEKQENTEEKFSINKAVSVTKEEVKLVEKIAVEVEKGKTAKRKGFFTRLFGN